MKALPIVTLALALVLLSSCGGPKSNTQEQTNGVTPADTTAVRDHDDDAAVAYACPMHPEVTGKQGDTCSECGMDLEKVEHED